jgi:hypothetical protein
VNTRAPNRPHLNIKIDANMEAVAATASIVGILGFVGHSVSGLAKLQAFFDKYERAPSLAKKLRKDISGLETTLLEVQEVIKTFQKAHNEENSHGIEMSTGSLDQQVKLCSEDIDQWVKITKDLNPKTKTGFRMFFKRVKVALSGVEMFQAFTDDIVKHRQSIGSSLAVLTV